MMKVAGTQDVCAFSGTVAQSSAQGYAHSEHMTQAPLLNRERKSEVC